MQSSQGPCRALLLHWERALPSPRPSPQSVASSLHWLLSVASRSSRPLLVSSPVSALKGRPGELPRRVSSSLATSRRQPGKPGCSRCVVVSSPVSPLSGRPGELPPPSLNWKGALLPSRPSLQSSEELKLFFLHWWFSLT